MFLNQREQALWSKHGKGALDDKVILQQAYFVLNTKKPPATAH